MNSSIIKIEPFSDNLKDGYDTQHVPTGVQGCVGSVNVPYIWQGGEYKTYVNHEDWIATDVEGKKYIIPIGVVKLFGLTAGAWDDSKIDLKK